MNEVGKLIEGEAFRDAIHIAVMPGIAGCELKPGDRVGFEKDGVVVDYRQCSQHVGVVDPFLDDEVKEGERFWVFMFPKSVMNLRHDWAHPMVLETPPEPTDKEASTAWLRVYAEIHDRTFKDMMAGVEKFLALDKEAKMEDHYKMWQTPNIFWKHYKTVTGVTGSGDFWGCCV